MRSPNRHAGNKEEWMLRRVALVRTDVSEELSVSIIGMTTIGELGTTPFSQCTSVTNNG
jgi:hypothetical protein